MSTPCIEHNLITTRVREFYSTLQFNISSSPAETIREIVSFNHVERNYPELHQVLFEKAKAKAEVLEVGCGAGWLSNSLAYWYGCNVIGVDLNPIAIDFSKAVASRLQLKNDFFCEDFILQKMQRRFDVIVSVGVLHHMPNCFIALKKIFDLLNAGGAFFIGLYHQTGRRPFLERFEKLKADGLSNDELFEHYCRMHTNVTDETRLKSWFFDQVLHPYESQHTAMELGDFFQGLNSNRLKDVFFGAGPYRAKLGLDDLAAFDRAVGVMGEDKNRKNQYFPGFFTVIGQSL